MRTLVTCLGFGAAFVVGLLLLITGTAGGHLVDCPALMRQFPAPDARCNLFSGFVFGGGLMVIVGGAVSSWTIAFGKWPD